MEKNILIVHYNTPELTEATVASVLKHTPDARITIFDNSDKRPYKKSDNVILLDNTKQQILNFDRMIEEYPNRRYSKNNYGSAKHCRTIEYCMHFFEEGFVLLDSDVLVKKDLSELFDESLVWIGQYHKSTRHKINITRLYPFCCFINTLLCRKHNVHYFDPQHMWELSEGKGGWYDTGAWFLEATRNLPSRKIFVKDYVLHYGGASFLKDKDISQEEWLRSNEEYYK